MINFIAFLVILAGGPSAQAFQTLCPGATLGTLAYSTPWVVGENTVEERIQRDGRHLRAMNAAAAIYDYGNYDSMFDSGANLAAGLKRFVYGIPAGYELAQIKSRDSLLPNPYVNAYSGLKFMILAPSRDHQAPWILAIAGTQTVADWLMDLDLGRFQLEKMGPLFELFTTCNQSGPDNVAIPAHDFIITGHSLGGGVAQAFAYQMQVARRQANLMPLRMELVTFNGFGAQPLVKKFGAYDTSVEGTLNATNYFVNGDVVSRIGVHIGPTRQLTPAGEDPSFKVRISQAGVRHVMSTVKEIAAQKGLLLSGLSSAIVKSPTEFASLNKLMGLGVIGQVLARGLYGEFTQTRIAETFEEALTIVEGERDQAVIAAMISLTSAALEQIDKASNGPMAQIRVERLNRVLRRLISIRQIRIQN